MSRGETGVAADPWDLTLCGQATLEVEALLLSHRLLFIFSLDTTLETPQDYRLYSMTGAQIGSHRREKNPA